MVNNWIKKLHIHVSRCLVCEQMSDTHSALCSRCARSLPRVSNPCIQCGEALEETDANRRCGRCQKQSPAFDLCIAPLVYRDSVKILHRAFKFNNSMAAGYALTEFITDALRRQRSGPLPQLLIPVPLHAKRMRKRGFDQTLEICKGISKQLEIPCQETALVRERETTPQSGLNRKQRQKNLRQAFSVTETLKTDHIALVDDVMTTGSTFDAAAKALKRAGALSVEVWAVSRTPVP